MYCYSDFFPLVILRLEIVFSEQTFFSKLERLVFAGHGTSLRYERYGDHAYIDMYLALLRRG